MLREKILLRAGEQNKLKLQAIEVLLYLNAVNSYLTSMIHLVCPVECLPLRATQVNPRLRRL